MTNYLKKPAPRDGAPTAKMTVNIEPDNPADRLALVNVKIDEINDSISKLSDEIAEIIEQLEKGA